MRYQLLKLRKGNSTKAERIFAETLKSLRIPFQAKVKIDGREIDFLIDNLAIEIDGHPQSTHKNNELYYKGYTTIHFSNLEITNNLNQVITTLQSCLFNQKDQTSLLQHETQTQTISL